MTSQRYWCRHCSHSNCRYLPIRQSRSYLWSGNWLQKVCICYRFSIRSIDPFRVCGYYWAALQAACVWGGQVLGHISGSLALQTHHLSWASSSSSSIQPHRIICETKARMEMSKSKIIRPKLKKSPDENTKTAKTVDGNKNQKGKGFEDASAQWSDWVWDEESGFYYRARKVDGLPPHTCNRWSYC